MNHEKALDRASKADAILKSEIFNDVFNEMRQAIFSRIETLNPASDAAEIAEMVTTLKLLRAVRAKFEQAVRDGTLAAFRLDEEQRKQ